MEVLRVHFLNVGHGDCTIIEHATGRITMIDINCASDWDTDTYNELIADNPEIGNSLYELLSGGSANRATNAFNLSGRTGAGRATTTTQGGPGLGGALLRDLMLKPQPAETNYSTLKALSDYFKTPVQRLTERGYTVPITDPIRYYLDRFPGRPIFRYVQTHPDLDHMRGLERLQEAGIQIINFWDTTHNKTFGPNDFQSDDDRKSWNKYLSYRKAKDPIPVVVFRDSFEKFYSRGEGADPGDELNVLAPTRDIATAANSSKDWNGHSYVLHLFYKGNSIIFGGDATNQVWKDIHGRYGNNLKCTVLKASHHGRDSGYYQQAVDAMNPDLTVVSVGKKPPTDASQKYANYSGKVVSTRWHGNVLVTIDELGHGRWYSDIQR